jgi:hypothetical protein
MGGNLWTKVIFKPSTNKLALTIVHFQGGRGRCIGRFCGCFILIFLFLLISIVLSLALVGLLRPDVPSIHAANILAVDTSSEHRHQWRAVTYKR